MAGPGALQESARVVGASLAVLTLSGLALVRVALPGELRGHEWLWVPATGACVLALALGALGYAAVPYPIALGLVLAAGAASSVLALRRHGLPAARPLRPLAWPVLLASLAIAVALVPMLRSGFATVIGPGSDAHLAVGTAQFLQSGHHPLSVAPAEPLDQVFPLWRSKTPIYYAFAAVSSVAGMAPFEVIAGLSAVLMALAGLGFYLLARERLGASVGAASAALALVLLDRSVLHTAMHPYFNQTWGFLALPYVLVLARPALEPGARGARVLLALFTAILALAYPLALPIGLAGLAAAWWHARRQAGLPLRPRGLRRRVWKGPRSLLWLVPVVLLAWIPALGVLEKSGSAIQVVLPGSDLGAWGGDLTGFLPWDWFFAVDRASALWWVVPVIVVGCVLSLRRAPADVRLAIGAVLAFGALAALWFRARDGGWYFHFKVLAFTAPFAVACAAVGLARLRAVGAVILVVWTGAALAGASQELQLTFDQVPRSILEVREVDARLPPSDSVRLDIPPNEQIWVAYFLAGQPLCSQAPLDDTSYPHVQVSRRADWVLSRRYNGRPADAAAGPPALTLEDYVLWRQAPGTPGTDRCSQRMVQRVTDPTT